jgi:hypothetical protein
MMAVAMIMIRAAAPATEPTMTGRLDEVELEVPGEVGTIMALEVEVLLLVLLLVVVDRAVLVTGGRVGGGVVEVLMIGMVEEEIVGIVGIAVVVVVVVVVVVDVAVMVVDVDVEVVDDDPDVGTPVGISTV